jgi:hypothetical protein
MWTKTRLPLTSEMDEKMATMAALIEMKRIYSFKSMAALHGSILCLFIDSPWIN